MNVKAMVFVISAAVSAAFGATTATHPVATSHAEILPFIHDDYARALSVAKSRKLPIFVEVWAPW